MSIELLPLTSAFRGLSDEDDEDPTVVDTPGDLDDDEDDEDEALGGADDDQQGDGALEE